MEYETFFFQCFDKLAVQQEGHPVGGGDDLTGALHILQLQLSPPPPSSLVPTSRMKSFWYSLT